MIDYSPDWACVLSQSLPPPANNRKQMKSFSEMSQGIWFLPLPTDSEAKFRLWKSSL